MKYQIPRWFIFFLLLGSLQVQAQEKTVVTGAVKDERGSPLRSVSVALLQAKDSSLVKMEVTDRSGLFSFSSPAPGQYRMNYSAIGFATVFSAPFEVKEGQSYNVPLVTMPLTSTQLQSVTVSQRKPLVEVLPDRTVFNVQNSISATGSTAFELLQKSPGVIIDNNDKITMKGKVGVRISVDGRLLQLGVEELAAWLKSLNSNDIATIEMIPNPGARYDASGNAGIINIRLKKNNALGTNGTVTAGMVQGVTPKGNGAVSINYRNKKVNLFTSAGINHGRYETAIQAPRTQKDTLYDQRLLLLSYNTSYNVRAGADYFISKRQTVGVMVSSVFNNEDWNSDGSTGIYYVPTNAYAKSLIATNKVPRKRTNFNTNLNYRYADTSGREINFDADYGLFRGRANSYQPNYYTDKDNALLASVITRNHTPTDIDIYTSKLDVNLPAGKGRFSFGAKFSYVKTNNTFDFFNEENGIPAKVAARSYHFNYKENVNAVYVSYYRPLNTHWTLQAGVRMEQTNSKGVLTRSDGVSQPDNNVKKDYTDLFPNATITWTVDKKNVLNLSYGRRIDRPSYQDLNPFEMKLDELSYVKGNSFLRPQFTQNIELVHTWKSRVNTSVSYSHVKDYATQTVDTLNNFTYALAKNLAQQDIVNLSISSPLTITSWWNGFVNIWFNYQVFKGRSVDSEVDLHNAGYGLVSQHTFTLGHDYSAELSGWFNGPMATGPTWKAKSMGAVDIGFQKLLFRKRATLKVTATDIFRSAIPYRATNDFGGLVLNIWVSRESQTARISFTYRFGNNKVKAARQRQTGLEAETQRIKAG